MTIQFGKRYGEYGKLPFKTGRRRDGTRRRVLDLDVGTCYDGKHMKVVKGKVVGGRIVVEGEPLEKGRTVTVLAPEGDEAFELDSEAEALLLDAIAEGDRGEVVTGEQLIDKLRG